MQVPYLAAREALLDIFEDQKGVSDRLENVTALSRLSLADHINRFKIHFLAAVGVAYTRTGADTLKYHLTKTRRHVGSLLQILTTSQLSEQNRGSKGQFASYDQKAFRKGPSSGSSSDGRNEGGLGLDLAQLAQCREVDQSLCRALVVTVSLIEAVAAGGAGSYSVQQVCSETKWTAAYANWIKLSDATEGNEVDGWTIGDQISHLDEEERVAMERRYVLQRLHKVQSTPGLMDLLTLLAGLLSSLLNSESIGNLLDSERREGEW
jgi:hypothetical protein